MSRRRRIGLLVAGVLMALLLAVVIAGILVVRSDWFFGQVRSRIVSIVEKATGGRTEIGRFRFDWRTLHAEVDNFVLHGTEPAGKPPLLQAAKVEVGLKIISLTRRDVDIASLDIDRPRVYLTIAADGSTNVPAPKVKRPSSRSTAETILDLAIGRFSARNGEVEVESRGATPFDVRGQNLQAKFVYEAAAPRYRGDVSIDPLDLRWGARHHLPLHVNLALGLERNHIEVTNGRIATGDSAVTLRGAVDNLAAPHGIFQYDARAAVADIRTLLEEPGLQGGTAAVSGELVWNGGQNLTATGNLRATGVDYRGAGFRISGGQAEGPIDATLQAVRAAGLRLQAVVSSGAARLPVAGAISSFTLEGDRLTARGVALNALGGAFRGDAELRNFARYRVEGQLAGFQARRLAATFGGQTLPWDAVLSGPARIEGNLRGTRSDEASAQLTLAPAGDGEPVRGQVAVNYSAARRRLDLGQSFLALPHSRVDLTGAIGDHLRVHVETRDLNDFLPALGVKDFAGRLEGGVAKFDGTVTGPTDDPRVSGRLTATRVSYAGTAVDSLAADVTAAPSGVTAANLQLARGALRVTGKLSLRLDDWKTVDAGAVEGEVDLADAPLADLLAIAQQKDVHARGTVAAAVHLSGTLADPSAKAELTLVNGAYEDEPFDRLTATAVYTSRRIEVASARIAAGERQVDFSAAYDHARSQLDSGRLTFQATSNVMALDQFRTLEKTRPGVEGTAQLTAKGVLDIQPARPNQPALRVVDLHGDLRGRSLHLTGQPLGDFRLTADSESGVLRANLASDFANSRIRGAGEWRLAGDYPGTAKITFTRVDFRQLRAWLAPSSEVNLIGSAEGELLIEGPTAKPELLKATLTIPTLEVAPATSSAFGGKSSTLALRNQGPLVATLAGQVVTVSNARLVGSSTDLTLTGKAQLGQKNPLDFKVNGRIDVALLHELDRDIESSGIVQTEASIRGTAQSPQINGRMELKNAALSLADVPNGISNANGVIVFSGDRATIQSLTGETGGGTVTITGFAGYGGGQLVFHLNASAEEVRVRYPEGVSTVADAELSLTGTTDRSLLSGTVTILRTGFNPQSDLSSILAKSAEPVRTPSSRTGFLGGLNLDVQVETSPDTTFQSSLAEGLQAEANLRLRGTATNPALLGRVNLTQGQIVFFGTKYNINQGSIAFYNPVKVEPVLNVDLDTKARGIDVTLTVSGPINKLTLTPRSDPPLQFSEIVALLATGRAPTSDPSQLAAETGSPQSFQQMGASALLGQAIANPVAGRLQRFFGVSKLKIDPTLTGVENNPQARLTLEQQVTQNLTFTYITNLTNSNPQVVRVEWSFSKQWSAVAVREENGLVGLDFFYKRRLK